MITTAVFDTKPYDRDSLARCPANTEIKWRFLEFRLSRETAPLAQSAPVVCVFVNDRVDRPCLETLAAQGVKLVNLDDADLLLAIAPVISEATEEAFEGSEEGEQPRSSTEDVPEATETGPASPEESE